MKKLLLLKYLFFSLIITCILLQAQNVLSQTSTEQFGNNNAHDNIFLDYKNIKIDNDHTYNIEQSTIDWGNEDTGNGLEKMNNITIELWNNKPKNSFNIIDFNTWYEFLNCFSEMEIEDFNKPLDKSLLIKINNLSNLWYKFIKDE